MKIKNNADHNINVVARNIDSFMGLKNEIAIAIKQKNAESNQSMTTANFLDKPNLINLWDRWSFPPWKGDTPLRSLEKTATVVSRIGIASKSIGIAKEEIELLVDGLNLTVSVAINTPKKRAPASPI